MKTKKIASRYGVARTITDNGHGLFTVEGDARYYRVGSTEDGTGIAYFDPEGGPFIHVGTDMDEFGGKVTDIVVEKAPEGKFKIRLEVEPKYSQWQ